MEPYTTAQNGCTTHVHSASPPKQNQHTRQRAFTHRGGEVVGHLWQSSANPQGASDRSATRQRCVSVRHEEVNHIAKHHQKHVLTRSPRHQAKHLQRRQIGSHRV
jgi:hypothetical protein